MKKLLLLGGSRYALPVIEAAHKLGCYVITCDFLPDNVAHKYSDEYHNVSIIDEEAVLELAKRLKIDGIMSFACDPGVVTAAYVAEKLGLPTNPYKSVEILQNKAKFRKFLTDNGFNVPIAKGYNSIEEAVKDAPLFKWPVIVKPTDSAGSKGVTKVEKIGALKEAIQYAVSFSKTQSFIIEEFIEKQGFSSDTDCFSVDGRLVFCSFNNQMFDNEAANPYTPSAYNWPSDMPWQVQKELRSELQRLISLLNLKTSIYNIETRLGTDGKPYIMEVTPRGGGNRLAEMLRYATGTDLILNAVRAAVNTEIKGVDGDPVYKGAWAEVVLHSDKDGVFDKLNIDSEFEKKYVIEKDLWIQRGDKVHKFTGANFTVGIVVLKFNNNSELKSYMNKINDYIKISVI